MAHLSASDGGAANKRSLDRNVYATAAVSFFNDASTEMIYPLLPVFLTTVLGASAGFLGVIEGGRGLRLRRARLWPAADKLSRTGP